MDQPGTYLIHADITASGVIERNDVVGAVFGQTEGLLGDDLDLRALQAAQRAGRVEVEVQSEAGVTSGTIRIRTDMDRVETAVLAAALETIEQIGPCRASVEIDRIEDLRAAKRREVFDRAQQLVASGFEDAGIGSSDLVDAVRTATSPVEISEYAGFPAGPNITSEDEIIIVEGRADVARLLRFGITNVIGVEGTDVPEEIAALTGDRTVTAFFDGDRGGDLLLLELAQTGDIDYVTFAPPDRSVEDLSHGEILNALSEKVPYELTDAGAEEAADAEPETTPLREHVEAVIDEGTGEALLLDAHNGVIVRGDADELEELLSRIDTARTAVIDGTIGQQEADRLTNHGVNLAIAREVGEFTKRPRSIRVIAADRILEARQLPEQ